ncbi:Conserved_hypothetical protein [Hexamita inflata]|uniref:Uncharacterized protein n=1 Tax=Hexamita inflata TaxID=28002 RepID=A0AA86N915_9EUKA|nr:Conserved hypothetical protein [Hexamita inflata]
MINNVCQKVNCIIFGQFSINGNCQCAIFNQFVVGENCMCPDNAFVLGNTCVCPQYSSQIGTSCICDVIPNQVMLGGVCACQTAGAVVRNGSCACGTNAQNISNVCTCPINSSLINGECVCNTIQGQIILNGSCQCLPGQYIIDNQCRYEVQTSYFVCNQYIPANNINIAAITSYHIISDNYSNGYVFTSSNLLRDSFVQISDNVYTSTVQPLFQTQSTFTNIKIQIGTQTVNSGSIVSNQNTIVINQLHIISQTGTQISVGAGNYLNILQQTVISANISNLIVNMVVTLSQGNITLVNVLNGVVNITSYQILGEYQSMGVVALIGISIVQTNLIINSLTFTPNSYNVGNYSSFFISFINMSTVQFNQVAIKLGNQTSYMISNEVQPNTQYWGYDTYVFGGLIMQSIHTSVYILNLIYDCKVAYQVLAITDSGLLIGSIYNKTLPVQIQNLCFQHIQNSLSTGASNFGLIGSMDAQLLCQHSSILLNIKCDSVSSFGIIAYQNSSCVTTELSDLRINAVIQSSSQSVQVSSVLGKSYSQNILLQNIVVNGSNIGAWYFAGILVAGAQNNVVKIVNSTVINSNVSAVSKCGGLIGTVQHVTIIIQNSIIESIRISCTAIRGIIVGEFESGSFNIMNSKSIGSNYINDLLQTNCSNFLNSWSITQC